MDQESVVDFPGPASLANLLEIAQAGTDAGIMPCLAKVSDWLAFTVKDKRAVRPSRLPGSLDDLHKLSAKRQHPLLLILAVFSPKTNSVGAYVPPLERLHFTRSPTGQV